MAVSLRSHQTKEAILGLLLLVFMTSVPYFNMSSWSPTPYSNSETLQGSWPPSFRSISLYLVTV